MAKVIKKFRNTDSSYNDEDRVFEAYKNTIDKHREKRVERALKTKDISALIEDEDDDWLHLDDWSKER